MMKSTFEEKKKKNKHKIYISWIICTCTYRNESIPTAGYESSRVIIYLVQKSVVRNWNDLIHSHGFSKIPFNFFFFKILKKKKIKAPLGKLELRWFWLFLLIPFGHKAAKVHIHNWLSTRSRMKANPRTFVIIKTIPHMNYLNFLFFIPLVGISTVNNKFLMIAEISSG